MNDMIKMCLKQYDKLHGKHKRTRTLCIKIELRVLSLWRLRLSLPFVQNAFVCSVRCVLLLVSSATVLQPMHVGRSTRRQKLHISTEDAHQYRSSTSVPKLYLLGSASFPKFKVRLLESSVFDYSKMDTQPCVQPVTRVIAHPTYAHTH
jgi:hypothetical protein